jgi:hypothetical protein
MHAMTMMPKTFGVMAGLLLIVSTAQATTLTITEGGWGMVVVQFDGGFAELPDGQHGFAGDGFELTTQGGISGGMYFGFDLTLNGVEYTAPCPDFDFCDNLPGLPFSEPYRLDVLDGAGTLVHFDVTGETVETIYCHVDDPQPGDVCDSFDGNPVPWFSVRYHPAGVPNPQRSACCWLGVIAVLAVKKSSLASGREKTRWR